MQLRAYLRQYEARRDVSSAYVRQLDSAIVGFGKFIGREPNVDDLVPATVNTHLRSMRDAGRSDCYRRQRLVNLCVLWNAAADDGLIPYPSRRALIRIKVGDTDGRTLRIEEVRGLIATATQLDGRYSHGIGRSGYWCSYLRAAWDTGLRGCDLRRLTVDTLRERVFAVVQVKTRKRLRRAMRQSTIDAIAATLPPSRQLAWPLWASLEMFRREARDLFKAAGISGSLKNLRSACGTNVELNNPGRGHDVLGNTRKIFESHYFDATQDESEPLMPEEL